MEAILRVTLSNTLLAAALALVALAISRIFRRPALSHALWLIVLLKLMTPPLWNVALPLMPAEKVKPPLPPTELSMPPEEVEPQIEVAQTDETERWAVPAPGRLDTNDGWHGQLYSDARALPQPQQHGHASTPAHATQAFPQLTISQALVIAWTAGSALCLLIIILRVRRFTSLLGFAEPADAHTQMQARALSSRVGMKNCPRVWFVPGPLCPMLWAFGTKARLLIPAGLWDRLDDAQRSTLLLHELAHYRRGDHWIRGVELLITILFWWNPIAWWARHELREAEEQCCDAWVIWTLPRSARDYAIALMEAIDFVSTTRCAVPVLASPMGEFHDLKRRLLMIKQHAAPRTLGWRGFTLICALAMLLLPLSATLAQQTTVQSAGLPPLEPAAGLAPVAPAAELPPATTPAASGEIAARLTAVTIDDDPIATAQREAQALVEEVQKTSTEIAKLTAQLHQQQARLVEIQRAILKVNPAQAGRGNGGGGPMLGGYGEGTMTTAPPMTRGRTNRGNPFTPNTAGGTLTLPNNGLTVNNDQELRLRNVEQKLDMLIQELHERRETQPDQPERPIRTRPGGPQTR